ncbi:hypothetical protein [Bacteroides reticulotermitis]|uniref:Uncharacterized protein n=1 Tax=Bacteroides reticulotermitis JCM 10512 TaxID=1445607 RepID=W4UZK8_9BACE|nr:hypothetical protein [Bacteroides reticulotermitis]GAE86396.1 hypothetical protein JCM10512_4907 [Bacteroides reticulotermitis JCM 10512]
MKRLWKTTTLLATICCALVACGDSDIGNEGDKDKDKDDNGKGEVPEPPKPIIVSITPIEQLNQGIPVINSHATSRPVRR